MGKEGKITGPVINGIRLDLPTHQADYGLHTKVVRKTADETLDTDTTLQNDDELLFAVAANEVWLITVALLHNTATDADLKVGVYGPSGAAFIGNYSSRNAATSHVNEELTAISASVGLHGTGADVCAGVLMGILTVSTTAGNFGIRWAQNTSQVTDTKVLTDSCLIATKLA